MKRKSDLIINSNFSKDVKKIPMVENRSTTELDLRQSEIFWQLIAENSELLKTTQTSRTMFKKKPFKTSTHVQKKIWNSNHVYIYFTYNLNSA
jgi:hypothetical protein